MNEVIKTENLKKHFGKVKAVDGISISVKKGEIYGFLGLNGAGKTTTIRMLLGMISPTSGDSYLKGNRVSAGAGNIWSSVGHLVEIPYSYPELTVRENLEMIRRLRYISDKASVDSVIEKLKLGQYRDRLAKNLSLGNAQRLGIAKALIHSPEILILDEPANGLDPAGIVEIRELLTGLAKNMGSTIFISSHILSEISKFATRIGIIHEGKMVMESNIDELDKNRKRALHVSTSDNTSAREVLLKQGYKNITTKEAHLEISDMSAISTPENINSILVHAKYPPSMLKAEEEDLESYFFRVIGKDGESA